MIYSLLNAISFPFQAGLERITVATNPKELAVAERIFENNRYQYTLQLDKSLLSWRGRVSTIVTGVFLCLPFIGHITSLALRYFSSSIFPEMPLDFAIKCSPNQKLEIAKLIYTQPQEINDEIHKELAKILLDDKESCKLAITHVNRFPNTQFAQKILPQMFAKQMLREDFTDPRCIIHLFNDLNFNETLQQKVIKELLLQARNEALQQKATQPFFLPRPINTSLLDYIQPAINCTILQSSYKQVLVQQLLKEGLADTLLNDKESYKLVVTHINASQDIKFIQRVIERILSMLILKEDFRDPRCIIHLFNDLNFNEDLQQKAIKELLLHTTLLSYLMQIAIHCTILQSNYKHVLVQQLLKEGLADTLLNDKEGCKLVIAHINFSQDIKFTQKIIQQKPDLFEQIKSHFVKQILEKDPADPKFIIYLFNDLNLNKDLQQGVIKELLRQIKDSTPSDKMQEAIILAIIDKYPRGPAFLIANISLFKHTQKLADLLVEMPIGKTYITNNITKFEISEEQKNSLLQKCITPILV